MSLQSPSRLLELAGQSLLRSQSLTIFTRDELPREVFPLMFTEAFSMRYYEALKLMVQAWPFLRLPLGSLMKTPHLETLRAVLKGLDTLLAQKVRPRRWKLQVLDLRDVDENFWTIWSGARALSCSPEAVSKRQTVEDCPRTGERQPLKVFIDLCLKDSTLDECLSYLCGWVHYRRGLVHLCCSKVRNYSMPTSSFRNLLERIDSDSIQELEVRRKCSLNQTGKFAPYLSRMSNLHKLFLAFGYDSELYVSGLHQFIPDLDSPFLCLSYPQMLYIRKVSNIKEHLEHLLRCLKNPLEAFTFCHAYLADRDMGCLSQYPSLSQLKELRLIHILMWTTNLEPLGALLEKVAATLKTLVLEDCRIQDPQLRVLLPALSRCSQLTTFNFRGNETSTNALKDLLCHTGGLSKLGLELYPAPLESLDNRGHVSWEILAPIRAELMRTLREVRQPKRVFFGPVPCPSCGSWPSEKLDFHLCS
ncbi:PRAME family member 17-like [Trachypithecus francoisi]|uniref:PRAME family member 17-like n=1 Tax=Trachypithecus francoisi TaxID=54180 RepID=UPI00141BDED7|nr:PRAME family member 17-like [Trachypithecus francoisi]